LAFLLLAAVVAVIVGFAAILVLSSSLLKSKRKEIRVRPGYKPPEDVELYKNRAAAAWKNRGKWWR
jgi:hypothetical protein